MPEDANSLNESVHTTFSGEFYCRDHRASFEAHEAEQNGGDCPWCGREVEGL